MISGITLVILCLSLYWGRRFFKRWYNPISIYALMWSLEIILYEIRLVRYPHIADRTWLIIGAGFFGFMAGVWAYFWGERLAAGPGTEGNAPETDEEDWIRNKTLLNGIILATALLGIVGAVQHWQVLLREFGSIGGILLNGPAIYRMRVAGEIHGLLPYVTSLLNVSIFFSGIYTGRYGLLSLGMIFAFGGVVIEDLANFGREGMLFAFCEFVAIVLVFRARFCSPQEKRKVRRRQLFSLVSVFLVVILFASVVRSLRSGKEVIKGASRKLNRTDTGTVITPSMYLYFSSQIVVLNQYLQKENEFSRWGENTFLPVYNVLSKFGIVQRPSTYQEGYFIPVWSNTGTYLREIHSDFGILGVIFLPFLLGLFSSFFWVRYLNTGRTHYLVFLTYLLIVVHFTFLMMITRSAKWWISSVIILILLIALNRMKFGVKADLQAGAGKEAGRVD
jgi:oligosaccharide repeat unit polymerase